MTPETDGHPVDPLARQCRPHALKLVHVDPF
jgi:hypothetical protein